MKIPEPTYPWLVRGIRYGFIYCDPHRRVESPFPGIFVFDCLERAYCRSLLDELSTHGNDAPNTMNRYGLVLKDIGLGHVCEDLLAVVVRPLSHRFFPHVGHLRHVHGFTVDYERGKQRSLSAHHDQSDVTLNVCLGENFTGGKLLFRNEHTGKIEAEVDHRVGQAVLHLGSHVHQAQGVKSGKRTNLILWTTTR